MIISPASAPILYIKLRIIELKTIPVYFNQCSAATLLAAILLFHFFILLLLLHHTRMKGPVVMLAWIVVLYQNNSFDYRSAYFE